MNSDARAVVVGETMTGEDRLESYWRKTAAFEEWRQRLHRGDRLPRGKFFEGKQPGRKLVTLDEFWKLSSTAMI